MRHIAIDCRFGIFHAGLGSFTREIVSRIVFLDPSVHFSLIVRKQEEWIPKASNVTVMVADIPHYSLREQRELPRILKKSGAELFLALHLNVPFTCPIPFVFVLHDLILHTYPNNAPLLKRIAYRILVRRAVQKAKKIITVTNFVRQELTDRYGASARDKAITVYEGVDPAYHPMSTEVQADVRARYNLESDFYLYVGNAKQHKNVPLLIEAFQRVQHDATLVLVMSGKEGDALILPDRVKRLQHVPTKDLAALYSAAKACVTASLYEGFCLPAVEALACACPVIAVREGPLEEITKGHATLVEPTVEALATAMNQVKPCTERFAPYSWDTTAREIVRVILSLSVR